MKQDLGEKRSVRKTINKLGLNFSLTDQNVFGKNISLSPLFSIDQDTKKPNVHLNHES